MGHIAAKRLVLTGTIGEGAIQTPATIVFQQTQTYVCDEGFQKVSLVPQWVVNEPIAEGDDPMGEVVLC